MVNMVNKWLMINQIMMIELTNERMKKTQNAHLRWKLEKHNLMLFHHHHRDADQLVSTTTTTTTTQQWVKRWRDKKWYARRNFASRCASSPSASPSPRFFSCSPSSCSSCAYSSVGGQEGKQRRPPRRPSIRVPIPIVRSAETDTDDDMNVYKHTHTRVYTNNIHTHKNWYINDDESCCSIIIAINSINLIHSSSIIYKQQDTRTKRRSISYIHTHIFICIHFFGPFDSDND